VFLFVCEQPAEICERNADTLIGSCVSIQPLTSSVIKTSPALAHGADSSYLLTTNITVPDVSTSSASLPYERPASTASRPAVKGQSSIITSEKAPSTYRGLRSVKHKNDHLLLSGGNFDVQLRKTSSLQDVTDGSTSSIVDTTSGFRCSVVSHMNDESLHGLNSSYDACSSCMNSNRSIVSLEVGIADSGEESSSCVQRRARGPRRRAATMLELEQVGRTGIVSNTAMFWKELLSQNSTGRHEQAGVNDGARLRHSSVDNKRRSRRDILSPRYLTIAYSPRDARMNETDERKVCC